MRSQQLQCRIVSASFFLGVLAAVALASNGGATSEIGYEIAKPDGYALWKESGASSLYNITVDGYGSSAPLLVVLRGSRYQANYDYGKMLGTAAMTNLDLLLEHLLPKALERDAFELFLQWQFDEFLSKQIPQPYKDEIDGFAAGAAASGVLSESQVRRRLQQSLVIASFPGDFKDNLEWLLIDELKDGLHKLPAGLSLDTLRGIAKKWRSTMQCSFYAIWGSRTKDKELYACRNLDWVARSGLATYKLVTVYHIDGTTPHATFGFAGMIGALAGMSAKGVTVHEAGNDNKKETFDGFVWVLRLRDIMEHASTTAEAEEMWRATNNTMGMNHMVSSGIDNAAGNPPALVFETMAGYSAYFRANDPRERSTLVQNVSTGLPLPDAVWRTNHGYDPHLLQTAFDHPVPGTNSEERYMLIAEQIRAFENSQALVGDEEAVALAALPADKGGPVSGFHKCERSNFHDAASVLSVVFRPQASRVWVAWESGEGDSWTPACCGTYVELDLAKWFSA